MLGVYFSVSLAFPLIIENELMGGVWNKDLNGWPCVRVPEPDRVFSISLPTMGWWKLDKSLGYQFQWCLICGKGWMTPLVSIMLWCVTITTGWCLSFLLRWNGITIPLSNHWLILSSTVQVSYPVCSRTSLSRNDVSMRRSTGRDTRVITGVRESQLLKMIQKIMQNVLTYLEDVWLSVLTIGKPYHLETNTSFLNLLSKNAKKLRLSLKFKLWNLLRNQVLFSLLWVQKQTGPSWIQTSRMKTRGHRLWRGTCVGFPKTGSKSETTPFDLHTSWHHPLPSPPLQELRATETTPVKN